jgi:hypothetical protein
LLSHQFPVTAVVLVVDVGGAVVVVVVVFVVVVVPVVVVVGVVVVVVLEHDPNISAVTTRQLKSSPITFLFIIPPILFQTLDAI